MERCYFLSDPDVAGVVKIFYLFFTFGFWKDAIFSAKSPLFQIILDAKDAEQDEFEGDSSRSSVAECLEHIEVNCQKLGKLW